MKKRDTARILLVVCALILLIPHSFSLQMSSSFNTGTTEIGNIYYVDKNNPNASDSNPGTENFPWLTIQKAADTMEAGDTVYIKEGIYNERVIPRNSGSPGNYISYVAYPGDTVTVNGENIPLPSDWGGLFDISDKSYIRVSCLRITNAGPNDNNAGILVDGSSHVIIEKNYIYNTVSSGIGVWNSDNIIIDGNEVELACNDGEQECITMAVTNIFEIKNNHVHDGGPGTIGGEGIDVKDGSSNGKVYKNHVHHLNRLGIYVDAWNKHTYNIEVFQNVVHDCASGFAVASERGGLLENVRIYNNIAYHNEWAGVEIGGWDGGYEHPMRNIIIINNNFCNNGGEWGVGIYHENPDAEDVIIRNNICSQNTGSQIEITDDVQNFILEHHLIDGYSEYYGDDYIEGNPLFINPSGGDFHLQKNSPAIDNGFSVNAPNDDFDGNPRPQGKGYDIGAHEYCDDGTAFQKGFSYAAWWNDTYLQEESDASLENLYATGTEWVSLVTTWYQEGEHSTRIVKDNDSTPSDASVIHAIETIHSLGMKVMLKPHVDLYNDEWRGEIWFNDEEDWSVWFDSYKQFICHYAKLAENHDVEQFCIGCELVKTVQREEWNEVIEVVRENFSGPITYAADWSNYQNVTFWQLLDFVGIDAYFELTEKNNPSMTELLNAWENWKPGIEEIHDVTGMPVVFTEIGYRSIDGCNRDPWNWQRTGKVDLQEQADCYEAAFKTFYHEKWFRGFYWWMWEPDPDIGGPTDDGYTPYKKLAEDILKAYYQNISISVKIEKPKMGYLYIFDREILPINRNTIIVGGITVEANSNGNMVEFYIDDELKSTDTESPYEWFWDETVFGLNEIKVIAYDEEGNKAEDEMNVIILNI